LGMPIERVRPEDGCCLVWRKVMAIVLELKEPELLYQAIGRVSCDQVDLLGSQGAIGKREVHLARRRGKLDSVCAHKTRVTVSSRHEVLTKPGAPLLRISSGLRNRLYAKLPRIVASDKYRERVVETQRIEPLSLKLVCIFRPHLLKNLPRISHRRL